MAELRIRPVVRMPNVTGQPIEKARLIVENAGLRVDAVLYRESYEDRNVVLEQKPARGQMIYQGDPVTLYISRRGYMELLPAIYRRSDPTGRNTTRDICWILEHMFGSIDEKLDRVHEFFDPYECPDEFLPWLASWTAMVFDMDWPAEKKRSIIKRATDLYNIRGTVRGLKLFLELFTGHEPKVIENTWPFRGFRVNGDDDVLGEDDEGRTIGGLVGDETEPHGLSHRLSNVGGYGGWKQGEGDPVVGSARAAAGGSSYSGGGSSGGGAGGAGGAGGSGSGDVVAGPHMRGRRATGAMIGVDSVMLPPVDLARCFIVEMPVRFTDTTPEMVTRIHQIIQAEKPANTHYYLRFASEESGVHLREFFAIGVRSGIGIKDEVIEDTITEEEMAKAALGDKDKDKKKD